MRPNSGPGLVERAGESPGRRRPRLDYLIAALILALLLLEGPHTIHAVGISWDEPVYFPLAKNYLAWAKNLGSPGAFSAETLEQVFGLNPDYYQHPSLTKILPALTMAALERRMGKFWAYRMSAPILFGLLLAALYLRVAPVWGRRAGLAAALCLAAMPRFFVEGHIAATDAPLSAFWFLCAWAFEAACSRRRLAPLAGIAYGLLMSVKFSGFLIPVPLIVWGMIYRRRTMLWPTLALVALGPLTFILLQPGAWYHPLAAPLLFIQRSASGEVWGRVWSVFLGQYYVFSPPWYYAPFLVLVTTPVLTLTLFLVGVIQAGRGRFRDPLAGSGLLHFGFFMALTMAPNAPLFDGVRLFLPVLVFLAVLAGSGFDSVVEWMADRMQGLGHARRFTAVLTGLLAVSLVIPLLRIYPYGLEYYNALIGGVKGARERGMVTTYWWTVVTEDTLAQINRTLPAGAVLSFFPMDPELWNLYRELGLLRSDLRVTEDSDFDYLLMLSRPFWNCELTFKGVGVPIYRLNPIASLVVDQVPFWVLYQKPPQAPLPPP